MKKLLTLALLFSSFAFVPATKAENVKTAATLNNPQLRIQSANADDTAAIGIVGTPTATA